MTLNQEHCCHVEMSDSKICGEPKWEGLAKCIFHTDKRLKDSSYSNEILIKINHLNDDDTIESIDLTGYIFPEMDFSGYAFKKSLIARGAIFRKNISFQGCKFEGVKTDFSLSQFEGAETNFAGCNFRGNVLFHQTKFSANRTIFDQSIFMGNDVYFDNSHFVGQEISFIQTEFLGNYTSFVNTNFQGSVADFTGTHFNSKGTSFQNSYFRQELRFHKAQFKGDTTIFHKSHFNGDYIYFTDTKFISEITDFSESEFHGKEIVDFAGAVFEGNLLLFNSCQFQHSTTYFFNTNFRNKQTSFMRCWLKGERILFKNCNFISESTNFEKCVFENDVDFIQESIFMASKMFSGSVSFKNVIFKKPENVIFKHVSLSSVEFRGTDLRKIQFIDIEWYQMKRIRLWIPIKRKFNALYDEKLIYEEKDIKQTDIELLCHAYRKLTQNYEDNRNYSVADDFYFGEMEMARLKNTKWWKRYLISWQVLYRWASGYGQQWENSLFLIGLLFFGLPFIFLLTGLQAFTDTGVLFNANYWHALQYNFLNVTFQKDISLLYKPFYVTKNIAIIESLIIPVLSTLFILALRRRFKR